MANYTCAIRTNYFHIKDPDAFRAFMQRVYGAESPIELWEEKDRNGFLVFGFGAVGSISGLANEDDHSGDELDESSYDAFIDGLQLHIADDDAVIILEAGREKLRYIVGVASIITSKEYTHLDITQLACAHAAKLLNDPDWHTKCDY